MDAGQESLGQVGPDLQAVIQELPPKGDHRKIGRLWGEIGSKGGWKQTLVCGQVVQPGCSQYVTRQLTLLLRQLLLCVAEHFI